MMYYNSGDKYEGEYKDDQKNGKGVYFSDGYKYKGEYKNGLRDGKGVINNPLVNTNITTTPYERVLKILLNIKNFISNSLKDKSNLVKNIDWCIKIITSHSLYSYELKDKDAINQLSKENKDFNELVNFVSEYNEKVIKMNRKYNYILSDKLLQKSSITLNRRKIERKSSFMENRSHLLKLLNSEINSYEKKLSEEIKSDNSRKENNGNFSVKNKKNYIIENNDSSLEKKVKSKKKVKMNEDNNDIIINKNEEINSYNSKKITDSQKPKNKSILKNKKKFFQKDLNENSIDESFPRKQSIDIKNEIRKKAEIENQINSNLFNSKSNTVSTKNTSTDTMIFCTKKMSLTLIKTENILRYEKYDISKLITSKNFDIFKLESLIGYDNVLPLMGRTILENLGLLDEGIIYQEKLDKFLTSINNLYKPSTLYHNSMHGADVTQSAYIYITHSNAEKIAKTNVIDILSLIIAALGHDLGHPGLTNMFHMNDSTEIAITYNDISILENFHASLLFRTLRKSENNIFEKLSNIDYKIIRKRMISEILATDMANHGKVVSVIKSRIALNDNNEYKLNLLSGNEQTKSEEQQYLLDYIIHLADLGHNTKLFNISLRWVSLLSEEFWRQGDLEKKKNLPVSFLCDRDQINIPQSQKGFISGFILPTFESLSLIFPSLKFTIDNANNNLKEWQKLLDAGRLTGWTPPKNKKNIKKIKYSDNLGFTSRYVIKEKNEEYDTKNENNNNIKNYDINQNNSKIKNSIKINKSILTTKKTDFNDINKLVKKNKNQINNSYNNTNKSKNINIKEKIANSSKEIKRANNINDKANKHLKISILDDISLSNNSDINNKTEAKSNFFFHSDKNRMNLFIIDGKK